MPIILLGITMFLIFIPPRLRLRPFPVAPEIAAAAFNGVANGVGNKEAAPNHVEGFRILSRIIPPKALAPRGKARRYVWAF